MFSCISTFPVPFPWSLASILLCEDRCQIWYKSPNARYVKVQPLASRMTERRPPQRQVRRGLDVWMSSHPNLVSELKWNFLKVTDFCWLRFLRSVFSNRVICISVYTPYWQHFCKHAYFIVWLSIIIVILLQSPKMLAFVFIDICVHVVQAVFSSR